jgi:hypothetical protein
MNYKKLLSRQFWLGAVISRLIYFEKDRQSINLSIIPYKIKRREDVRKQYGEYKNVELFYLRISKLKGLEYISIRIAYFIFINIDFHRPI